MKTKLQKVAITYLSGDLFVETTFKDSDGEWQVSKIVPLGVEQVWEDYGQMVTDRNRSGKSSDGALVIWRVDRKPIELTLTLDTTDFQKAIDKATADMESFLSEITVQPSGE